MYEKLNRLSSTLAKRSENAHFYQLIIKILEKRHIEFRRKIDLQFEI